MIEAIAYSVNRSSATEIAAHLLGADAAFEPALSSRVNIRSYSQKLNDKAVRFEAWLGEQLVGLVASYCNEVDEGKAFVTSVSVTPEFQGQGIAFQLITQCIAYVRGLGFRQMELEVDYRSVAAVALYQKLGFNTLSSIGPKLIMSMNLRA